MNRKNRHCKNELKELIGTVKYINITLTKHKIKGSGED